MSESSPSSTTPTPTPTPTTTTTSTSTTSNNNNNNNRRNNSNLNPFETFQNSIKEDSERLVASFKEVGDKFSSFFGSNKPKAPKQPPPELKDDDFVLIKSTEEITKEMKDEELARALQRDEYERHAQLVRLEEARTRLERMREEEQRRHAEAQQRYQELQQLVGPAGSPDLLSLLVFGIPIPQQQTQARTGTESSSAPMYFKSALDSQPLHLPTHVYTTEMNAQDPCTICLCDYKEGDIIKTLPCMHNYHGGCIDAWLRQSRTCPICKATVE